LGYGGYKVLQLTPITPLFNLERLTARFYRIHPREVIMFSRQLALLLESGTDIATSLDLLESQTTNRTLKQVIAEVSADIRGGTPLSVALSKHPKAFSQLYYRTIAAGEQSGNLEIVLRQMADHIERAAITEKKVKNALTYPFIVAIVAFVVIVLMVTFVLPTFASLYSSFGVALPLAARIVIGLSDWASAYGLYLLLAIAAAIVAVYAYSRTPAGKYQWHKISLKMPIFGRINLLSELARCCRTMSLLFRVGLPLPEILAQAINGATNKVMADALTEVQQELIRGEGLSKPMSKRSVFLPMMVQMVGVGEETGNLDNTLATVAASFETDAEDRTNSAVGLIQPAITIFIGLVIGLIAIALVSAMYSLYGSF